MDTPPTVVAMLAALQDAETGLTVLDRRGRKKVRRPYPDVVTRARAWGAWLREQGVAEGDVVFLCLPTSHEIVEAFLGAVLIRALPCNLATPRAIGGLDVFRRRLQLLAEPFPGGHLIAAPDVGAEAGRSFWSPPEELDTTQLVDLEPADPAALAYVQLTSGSTTAPKAVAISHANLSANTGGIVRAGDGTYEDTYVSWLPLYHDMGLVGMLFSAMFHQCELVLMRPETFVGTPIRWLQAIQDAGYPVVTTAPNFGYQWCVDRIREDKLQGLDVSALRYACCGAEMVRPETLNDFRERFVPLGLRQPVFAPCYGMAETTLAVTMTPPGQAPKVHQGRVSCGLPIEGMALTIREPGGGAELADREIGEIVISGTSIYMGYYQNPEATAEVLQDGQFCSGDLGYVHEGELYVTGRLKDIIILDGVNVAPYELEWIADPIVIPGGRAGAFSVELNGREVPVLAVEVREVPEPEAIEAVRAQAAQDIAPLHDLVLVRRGTLPKTSSGKVKRSTVKASYLEGTLEVLWSLRTARATDQVT